MSAAGDSPASNASSSLPSDNNTARTPTPPDQDQQDRPQPGFLVIYLMSHPVLVFGIQEVPKWTAEPHVWFKDMPTFDPNSPGEIPSIRELRRFRVVTATGYLTGLDSTHPAYSDPEIFRYHRWVPAYENFNCFTRKM